MVTNTAGTGRGRDRDRVLELLRGTLGRARTGAAPALAVLTGPAATSAVRAAEERIEPGTQTIRAGCSALTRHVGLGPLARIAASMLEGVSLDSVVDGQPAWIRAALQDVIGRSDDPRELAEIYASVAHLIDAHGTAPLVLILEDIQNSGHGFTNFVTFLAARTLRRALVIVCTATDDFPAGELWPAADVLRVERGIAGTPVD